MQIYPRSYQDSSASNDGVGDLRGIISRLGYLKGEKDSLGIDAIWLSPIFTSPMHDFGYDVSDYKEIDPLFGTMQDFDDLLREAHARDIRVMLDFVPNHTSSEHQWFIEACKSRTNPYRDYYIFRDARPDGSPPNNWLSVFGGSAWQWHEQTKQYYLHSFLSQQPDLNWQNTAVQQAMADVLRFWFGKGVDGIRADAIRWMGKNIDLLDDPINSAFTAGQDPYHAVEHRYSRFSPELNGYLKIMTDVAREHDDKILIFEDHLDSLSPVESQIRRINSIDPEVAGAFNFEAMHRQFSARSFSEMINRYQAYLPAQARAFYCFSNHDESRLASRFGEKQARMLAVLQLTLPGTPVLYYGQEIGMRDGVISPEEVQDPFEKRVPNKGLGRDPARTPMQWSDEPMAGFTKLNRSWLPVNSDYVANNVRLQQHSNNSLLSLHKTLFNLRKQHHVLLHGEFKHLQTTSDIFMFERKGEERFIVVCNFSEQTAHVLLPHNLDCEAHVVAAAHNAAMVGEKVRDSVTLEALEALVLAC